MFEPLQLAISVGGVSLILFLVWLATRSLPAPALGGEAGVRARLSRELLAFTVGQVVVEAGDRRALVTSADGKEVALLFVMGGRVTCWRLPATKLAPVSRSAQPDGTVALHYRTGDFTLPSFDLAVPAPAAGALPGGA